MKAVAVCLSFFLVMLDSTIVTVALPSIGGGTATLQWVVDAYTVVFAALVLAGGSLADRFGARRAYRAGVTIFTIGSIMCAGGGSGAWLIAGRVVQGVGAAVLMPSSLALIRSTYPEPAAQARIIGLWGGLGGVAAAAGPLLGGALLSVAGWPALFLLNVPFAVLVLGVSGGLVDPPVVPGARVDVRGAVTSTCGLALLVAGCIAHRADLAVAGALVLGLFVALQRRVAQRGRAPMLRPDLLRHRALRATVITGFALNFGFYGQFFLVTLYLQQQRHLSPLLTGVALAVQAAGAVVGSPFGGWATHRSGPRTAMLIGLLTGAAGFVALALCAAGPLPAVLAALFVIGFGIDTAMTAATSLTLQVAPDGHAGVASGLLNTMRQVGSALGVAVLGAIGGFATAVLIAAGTYLAAAVLVALRTAPPGITAPATPSLPAVPRGRRTGGSS
ncbi:MFS transporter [Dactylosporangium siamense]|uniref:MFS transporter n=1 Tax=Dactylosporangium siamense TaxID=685454 RepID=A0A919PXC6_9ACTN|nr:MFS transporter [Dactylosporangium siamense]GIG51407.1 MFS transporter [Dactylosporangium siamense]